MNISLTKGIAAICCIACLVSCKRDVIKKIPSTVDCRIKQLIVKTEGMKDRTGTFTYNSYGDPVDYTPIGNGTGSVKYEFRYDQQRRLTDYIGYYPTTSIPPVFEFWTRYIYDDKNRIIRDTTYYYGRYGVTMSNFANFKTATTYEYDSDNRVGRTVSRQLHNGNPNGSVSDYKYVYNDQGNIVTPGAAYDDKVSVYRTHKLWMFLSRNYSVNNIKIGKTYNGHGLPTAFAPHTPNGANMRFLQFINFADCEIVYECK